MGEYSNYKLGNVDLETEKAYLAIIEDFTDKEIWVLNLFLQEVILGRI